MKLKVERKWLKATYTIGRLYIDGIYYCNTLEDRDRGLTQIQSKDYIHTHKVHGETAIPKGTYRVTLNVTSPKYAAVPWYWQLCKGKMPRLLNVPGFEGVLIHPGNTTLDTLGCILVGKNTKVGQLTESKATFRLIYKILKVAADRNEEITIEID